MKKTNNLVMGIVVLAMLFATFSSANGIMTKKGSETLNERYISVSDSTILLKLWDVKTGAEVVPYYAISLNDGATYVRTVQASYELGLRYAHFDPLVSTPTVRSMLSSGPDTHLYIVQFVCQPLENFKNAIESLGGHVRQYIAQYAYLVDMSQTVKTQVQSLPYTRWIGPYQPAYKLDEFMLQNLDNAQTAYPSQRYNIQVHSLEMKEVVADKIAALGGTQVRADAGKVLVQATLTPEQLFQVARYDEVNFIDRWGPYEQDMDITRVISGANYIETAGGFNGTGVRGEVFDGGVNRNHVDFQLHPLIVHGPSCGSDSHGSATTGICFGTGTGDPKGRGLCPDGQGIVADYNVIGLSGASRYAHDLEMAQDPWNCVFQTASVGDPQVTQYTTISADTDDAIFDSDVVHCQSQSNTGNQNSRPQAWAKNMISVGAVYHYDTLTRTDDMWNGGASIGPASDGRIKPDLLFFYDMIYTVGYPGNSAYTSSFGGTSGATPQTAGCVGLFFQMWSEGIFGNPVTPGATVFQNKCHFTTAKAMMIDTAYQYPFNGTTGDKIRCHQGWGMPNLTTMYDRRNQFYTVDETDVLAPFQTGTHTICVAAGQPELKVVMTYADVPGNPSVQTQHRINDLTLKVTSPSSTVYWGNGGLYEHIYSTPGGSADTKNTVECVFVQNPEPGVWTLQVSADEILADTHVETPAMDADYALVASPVMGGPQPPTINGSFEAYVGIPANYTVVSSDPLGGDLYYRIDWGDGNMTDWFGPFASGVPAPASHTWMMAGDYSIIAKVKTATAESGNSTPFPVTVHGPVLSLSTITGGLFFVKMKIKNIGELEARNVSWSIDLDGKLVLLGRHSNGTTGSIPVGGNVTVKSKFILGFGTSHFTATAVEYYGYTASRKQSGMLLGFFIKVNP